jgi:hypothetical protein
MAARRCGIAIGDQVRFEGRTRTGLFGRSVGGATKRCLVELDLNASGSSDGSGRRRAA